MRSSRIFSEWVLTYALDEEAFLRDFQRTLQRVLQVGGRLAHHPCAGGCMHGCAGSTGSQYCQQD